MFLVQDLQARQTQLTPHFILVNKKATGTNPQDADYSNTWTEYYYPNLPSAMQNPKERFSASSSGANKCKVETSSALSTLQIDSAQWNNNQNWTEDDETRPVNVAFFIIFRSIRSFLCLVL